jgi:hypothetical protein
MALKNPSFGFRVHGKPSSVTTMPENGGMVAIEFEGNSSFAIFCGSAAMAIDLEAAIASVIAKHTPRLVDEVEAA